MITMEKNFVAGISECIAYGIGNASI